MTQKTPYISRAGEKLQFALDHFSISPKDKVCADLGCSTGGFTDCLLQYGAKTVYAVDTGRNLGYTLKQDPRVSFIQDNACHVQLPEPVDLITIDVGWTKQQRIIPHAWNLLKQGGDMISLVKLSYEAEKQEVTGGKVNTEAISSILTRITKKLKDQGYPVQDTVESPLTGKKGKNSEYLIWLKKL